MPSEIATPSPVSLDRSAAVVDAPTPAVPPAAATKSTKSHLASGFISGLTSSVLLQPLDLLKTRVQQSKSTTLTSAIRDIDSVRSLWRGTLPSAIRTSVGSALYLTTLNATRTYVARYSAKTGGNNNSSSSALPKLSMHGNLLSGAIVRGAVGIVTMPVTVVKVRYESSMYNYSSMLQGITDIYSKHGVAGFFKGWGVTFLRDAPHAGLYVLFYEKSKDMLCLLLGDDKTSAASSNTKLLNTSMSAVVNSTSAALSAGMATTITGPFDTMKTRVQLDPIKYNSVATTVRIILQEEGFKGLFDGLSLRLARKAMSAGISWCIYEELIRRF
ncbi:hypothetical protein D0Z00_002612 [Geotrichum galactomycetum]|uniref:Uncharacterized protein n=1 Tax=Geotrichum galactomycetum TaxID=27317 RepID=A0ACB6V3M6_9ASCO|nr:hypothetical protein D0Z00_002612 [Geotrichum candidum]